MTVKELAEQLGVSKPTISKTMKELDIQAATVGNRFELTDEQCKLIRVQILQEPQTDEPEEPQTEPESATETQTQTEKPQTETEKMIISILREQIEILREQLTEKDRQLAEKDRQIADLNRQNENLSSALAAEQALHAGTIARIPTTQKPHFWDKWFNRKSASDEADAD